MLVFHFSSNEQWSEILALSFWAWVASILAHSALEKIARYRIKFGWFSRNPNINETSGFKIAPKWLLYNLLRVEIITTETQCHTKGWIFLSCQWNFMAMDSLTIEWQWLQFYRIFDQHQKSEGLLSSYFVLHVEVLLLSWWNVRHCHCISSWEEHLS